MRLMPGHLEPLSGTFVLAMRDPHGASRRFMLPNIIKAAMDHVSIGG